MKKYEKVDNRINIKLIYNKSSINFIFCTNYVNKIQLYLFLEQNNRVFF